MRRYILIALCCLAVAGCKKPAQPAPAPVEARSVVSGDGFTDDQKEYTRREVELARKRHKVK